MSEPLPEQPLVSEPEAPAEEEWSGPSQAEWEATQAQLQQYNQMLQQPQQPQPPQYQQQPPAPPDPFEDDFQGRLDAYIDYRMAGAQQLEQEIRLAQAEEFAMTHLNELASSGGEFDRSAAYARANMILIQQGGDPVQALDQAAKDVRDYEQRVGQAYYQQQIEQVQTNAGAPRGLPAGTIGGAQTVATGGLGNVPNAVTRKFFGGV
jgi:hypothetical protein